MNWEAIRVSPEEWAAGFSENMHKIVFSELKPASRDRISYALLIVHGKDVIGYVTVREMDDHNVYWQFGGAMPQFRRSMKAVKVIETALEWQKKQSKRIVSYVENVNLPMLRLYLAYGFIIIGTRTVFGKVMVEFLKEFKSGN